MITLKMKLPYNLPLDSKFTGKEGGLTADYIEHAVLQKYPTGLDGQKRRTWGRIQRKLDTAVTENSELIGLTEDEVYFLRQVFKDEILYKADIAKYVIILDEELDRIFGLKDGDTNSGGTTNDDQEKKK